MVSGGVGGVMAILATAAAAAIQEAYNAALPSLIRLQKTYPNENIYRLHVVAMLKMEMIVFTLNGFIAMQCMRILRIEGFQRWPHPKKSWKHYD